jgi:hypothetical protein
MKDYQRIAVYACILLIGLVILVERTYKGSGQVTFSYSEKSNSETEVEYVAYKKRHVFFDLGVNNGDSLLRFFNMRNRGNVGGDLIYKKFGAEAELARWIAYAFEANPKFNDILAKIKSELSTNHTVYLYNETAAWIKDGTIGIYCANRNILC